MRYYDLIETPKTEKTFKEGGENRILETDSRVIIYFQDIDAIKYDRFFDDNGYPQLREYSLKEDGTRYSHYLDIADENGINQPDLVAIEKLAIKNAIAKFTQKTNDKIQSKINDYNELHGLAFGNAHNCKSYIEEVSYPEEHIIFCKKIWDYNVALFIIVRTYQDMLIEIPSDEQFEIVLDSVEW